MSNPNTESEKVSGKQILEELFNDQRAAAQNPQHPINDRLRASLKAEAEKLEKIKKQNETTDSL
ncbi:hypothetical protein [Acinetobacter gyllenbergii]|uniref:hypothetical protein n=1 Tax=Acinetobacter gyllenbergii TaxID=134534 RepID=UPI003F556275